MKKLIFLFCFVPLCSFGQKIIINGQEGERPLTWNDFTGKIPKRTSYGAYTWWYLSWKCDNVRIVNDTVHFDYYVTLELDPDRSWVLKHAQNDNMLKHEQGHFDIGILAARKLAEQVQQQTFFKRSYKSKLRGIFNETFERYSGLNSMYDSDTKGGTNKEEQERWNGIIESGLYRFPVMPYVIAK